MDKQQIVLPDNQTIQAFLNQAQPWRKTDIEGFKLFSVIAVSAAGTFWGFKNSMNPHGVARRFFMYQKMNPIKRIARIWTPFVFLAMPVYIKQKQFVYMDYKLGLFNNEGIREKTPVIAFWK